MESRIQKLRQLYHEMDGAFTDREAWFLFKVSTVLETVGWTLLLTGIVFSHFKWPLYDWILPIAGSLHGIFVICYMLIVFFAHRSMRWGVTRFVVGELVSVIPYAAIIFEQWVAARRPRKNKS